MVALKNMQCVACRADAPRLTGAELEDLRQQIPDWTVIERDGVKMLQRTFKLPNFAVALELTDKVGALAEEQGHHPSILTEWGKLTVTWWTHKIRGLHQNDVVMAARTDVLASEMAPASPG